MISAAQIKEKAPNCAKVKGSLKKKTAIKNKNVGDKYCIKPKVAKFKYLAPIENKIKGIAVKGPNPINKRLS